MVTRLLLLAVSNNFQYATGIIGIERCATGQLPIKRLNQPSSIAMTPQRNHHTASSKSAMTIDYHKRIPSWA
ncbi:hypothetical protein LZ30DRAFT_738975 [Colletotrichum cereale]|nr:hypothetical protein LZ30DRAFT_738975 [Colletotrichum cereale]